MKHTVEYQNILKQIERHQGCKPVVNEDFIEFSVQYDVALLSKAELMKIISESLHYTFHHFCGEILIEVKVKEGFEQHRDRVYREQKNLEWWNEWNNGLCKKLEAVKQKEIEIEHLDKEYEEYVRLQKLLRDNGLIE